MKFYLLFQYAKETVVDNSFIDTIKEDQYQRPSPVSILDASFSSESCHSSESIEIASGKINVSLLYQWTVFVFKFIIICPCVYRLHGEFC